MSTNICDRPIVTSGRTIDDLNYALSRIQELEAKVSRTLQKDLEDANLRIEELEKTLQLDAAKKELQMTMIKLKSLQLEAVKDELSSATFEVHKLEQAKLARLNKQKSEQILYYNPHNYPIKHSD
jgi:chromosome segregation ATPase